MVHSLWLLIMLLHRSHQWDRSSLVSAVDIFTGLFRCFGANAEGVSFAIILSNILVPMIEKYTVPRAFGMVKEAKKQEGGK